MSENRGPTGPHAPSWPSGMGPGPTGAPGPLPVSEETPFSIGLGQIRDVYGVKEVLRERKDAKKRKKLAKRIRKALEGFVTVTLDERRGITVREFADNLSRWMTRDD